MQSLILGGEGVTVWFQKRDQMGFLKLFFSPTVALYPGGLGKEHGAVPPWRRVYKLGKFSAESATTWDYRIEDDHLGRPMGGSTDSQAPAGVVGWGRGGGWAGILLYIIDIIVHYEYYLYYLGNIIWGLQTREERAEQ